jgi:hypothetical protein
MKNERGPPPHKWGGRREVEPYFYSPTRGGGGMTPLGGMTVGGLTFSGRDGMSGDDFKPRAGQHGKGDNRDFP